MNYDGVAFDSSLDKNGRNYTIFYPEQCKAIGSRTYTINSITYKVDNLLPKDGETLSTKLRFHKKKDNTI